MTDGRETGEGEMTRYLVAYLVTGGAAPRREETVCIFDAGWDQAEALRMLSVREFAWSDRTHLIKILHWAPLTTPNS